jgi:hypothetical protein
VTRELDADNGLAGACARTPPQLSAATNEKSTMSERMRGAVFMIQGLRDCFEVQNSERSCAAVRDAAA